MRNLHRRALLVAPLTVTAALALTASAGAQGDRTLVLRNCEKAAFMPKTIVVDCADQGVVLTRLKWEDWRTSSASGAGTARVNDCEPNCAEGRTKSYPVNVRLSKPRTCDGTRLFSRVVYDYPRAKPEGPRRSSQTLPCPE